MTKLTKIVETTGNHLLAMDKYELTMSEVYFKKGMKDKIAVFDMFYRRVPDGGSYAIAMGIHSLLDFMADGKFNFTPEHLEYFKNVYKFSPEFLDLLKNLKFTGTITAVPEGTVVYPNVPIVTITAPIIEAQIIETALLLYVNHQTLIATKARRIVHAAGGRPVVDFGARRAHGVDASVEGAYAAYVAGATGTSNVLAGFKYGLPVSGTMAHSYIEAYGDEFEAFKNYAESYPDETTLLLDTYDTLKSGTVNAIRVQKEVLDPMGKKLYGVRLDSGDLAYLSKEVRKMLDAADMKFVKIVASNSLDEETINSLIGQGAEIDVFGVGERLITSRSEPVFGGVYKLVAMSEDGVHFEPRIKLSENVIKITNPGKKVAYRVYDETGHTISDLLALEEEVLDDLTSYEFVDPNKFWKVMKYENVTFKPLHVTLFKDGKRVYEKPNLEEVRAYVQKQLTEQIWETEHRLSNPSTHYVNMTRKAYEMKMDLLEKESKGK